MEDEVGDIIGDGIAVFEKQRVFKVSIPPEVVGIREGDCVISFVTEDGVFKFDQVRETVTYSLAHKKHITPLRTNHGVFPCTAVKIRCPVCHECVLVP